MRHTAADDAEWHMKQKKNCRNQPTFNRIIQLLKTYKGAPKEKVRLQQNLFFQFNGVCPYLDDCNPKFSRCY